MIFSQKSAAMRKATPKKYSGMPAEAELQALAGFRAALRQFLSFSEQAAAKCGATMQWYQAMLVISDFESPHPQISIGELAEQLIIRDHSATELANRLLAAGFVRRKEDPNDGRRSLLLLTAKGEKCLAELARNASDTFKREQRCVLNLFEAAVSMQRLNDLERENETLRHLVADLSIANQRLKNPNSGDN